MIIEDLNTRHNFCILLHTYNRVYGCKFDVWKRLFKAPTEWLSTHDAILEEVNEVSARNICKVRARFSSLEEANKFSLKFEEYFIQYGVLFRENMIENYICIANLLNYRKDVNDIMCIATAVKKMFPYAVVTHKSFDMVPTGVLTEKIIFAYDKENTESTILYFTSESDAVLAKLHL